ncbi:PREDICTED: putative F-box/FBD/LRR-repeat protein At3g49480 [Camelina sativa]|uniref:F-box/FBD/LRR-repeat protein At3g49480 n=1 Tax=Camelina sativa TaxID=90675 RepID=A0ABM0V670_CAMSA|nr:PREDICTED: putative F-box/FBD/LRR-repeat protein At3g49480 [Camelina sativa]
MGGEDRISELSDDLLVEILLFLPTKEAVATTFLSKRWRFVWRKLPRLDYKETGNSSSKSVWWFLDESMGFHNAPSVENLRINLGVQCPVDADVATCVAKAVDRCLRKLYFYLDWFSERITMPKSLYTCKTLTELILMGKILVDVPCEADLPSLYKLVLNNVVFKDEDSHVRLLSSCPVLKDLDVTRPDNVDDNVRKFTVKVPSLLRLTYMSLFFQEDDDDDSDVSLVIDTPDLVYLDIIDGLENSSCSINHMPRLMRALIDVDFYPDDNFLTSLSSIEYLELSPGEDHTIVPWCNAVIYTLLKECIISRFHPDLCESLVVLLSNCPKLEVLMVDSKYKFFPSYAFQPGSVPKCLSSHLMIFKWKAYEGTEVE